MTRNNYKSALIDERRRRVARLRLRGLTQREIVEGLARQGITNPNTGEPYELGTINSDLKAIQAQWKQEAAEDIAEHKGIHVAELKETRRVAWADAKGPKLFYVLKSLEQEAKVLGLEPTDGDEAGKLADAFMYGVHTVKTMQVQDLSE